MAHFDDLSSALQTALNKGVPGPFQVEVILDPDGDAIDLSSYIDRSGSLTITKSKAIRSLLSNRVPPLAFPERVSLASPPLATLHWLTMRASSPQPSRS